MNDKVRIERDGNVLLLWIDNPPINAGSIEVRRGLLRGIQALDADPALQAAVIIGAGDTFIAGSDLREFGQPLEDPQLPAVIAAIEASAKPVVAALHGAALGGGFELALGCDARIASASTQVGLPETTLGMIPGAGGTQRLPRLVGLVRALEMICSGERVKAHQALELGLVDRVVEGDLREAAVSHARGLAGKRRLRDQPAPRLDAAAFDKAAQAALRAGRQRPQIHAAIDAVRASAELPIDEALARERAVFQQLRTAPEAFALRHLFFAEREASRHPALRGVAPRPLQRVAVVGAGTMGAGIAICALDAGLDVTVLELDTPALDRGLGRVHQHYASRVTAGKLKATQAVACEARLSGTMDWTALAAADVVIEAVFEDLDTKRSVFERLAKATRPGTVLATNTSYLDIDRIAEASGRAHDVLGLHFFSPAQVMRLLEVVRSTATAPDVLATGMALARRLGKLPVLAGNAFGFIGNRIYTAYRRQCEFMLEEGATPQGVDDALQAFGFAMGPFAVADLSGLDIAWRMRQAQAATRDPRARYVTIPDRLCEAGRLGRKTGAGYYDHGANAASKGRDDPAVLQVIDEARSAKGMVPRPLAADEIRRRALLAMANEAALLLAEGVAQRPSDVDVVLVNGFGFPRWEGGPVHWARRQGAERLAPDIDWLAKLSGPGFLCGDVRRLFDDGR